MELQGAQYRGEPPPAVFRIAPRVFFRRRDNYVVSGMQRIKFNVVNSPVRQRGTFNLAYLFARCLKLNAEQITVYANMHGNLIGSVLLRFEGTVCINQFE